MARYELKVVPDPNQSASARPTQVEVWLDEQGILRVSDSDVGSWSLGRIEAGDSGIYFVASDSLGNAKGVHTVGQAEHWRVVQE